MPNRALANQARRAVKAHTALILLQELRRAALARSTVRQSGVVLKKMQGKRVDESKYLSHKTETDLYVGVSPVTFGSLS